MKNTSWHNTLAKMIGIKSSDEIDAKKINTLLFIYRTSGLECKTHRCRLNSCLGGLRIKIGFSLETYICCVLISSEVLIMNIASNTQCRCHRVMQFGWMFTSNHIAIDFQPLDSGLRWSVDEYYCTLHNGAGKFGQVWISYRENIFMKHKRRLLNV